MDPYSHNVQEFEFQKKLILRLISDWKRRKHNLLLIGSHGGVFLDLFWEAGFDLTCVEEDPWQLSLSKKRTTAKIDWQLSSFDHLPFGVSAFDYVVLFLIHKKEFDYVKAIEEGLRISSKAILICFYNRRIPLIFKSHKLRNLAGFVMRSGKKGRSAEEDLAQDGVSHDVMQSEKKYSPGSMVGTFHNYSRFYTYNFWSIRRCIIARVGERPMQAGSIMIGPRWSWSKEGQFFKSLNGKITSPVFGGFTALTVDITGKKPLTPIALWKAEPKPSLSN